MLPSQTTFTPRLPSPGPMPLRPYLALSPSHRAASNSRGLLQEGCCMSTTFTNSSPVPAACGDSSPTTSLHQIILLERRVTISEASGVRAIVQLFWIPCPLLPSEQLPRYVVRICNPKEKRLLFSSRITLCGFFNQGMLIQGKALSAAIFYRSRIRGMSYHRKVR